MLPNSSEVSRLEGELIAGNAKRRIGAGCCER